MARIGRPQEEVLTLSDIEREELERLGRSQSASHSGLSKSTVARMLTLFNVKPHRSKTFRLSSDPLFVDKVRDTPDQVRGRALPRPARLCPRPLRR